MSLHNLGAENWEKIQTLAVQQHSPVFSAVPCNVLLPASPGGAEHRGFFLRDALGSQQHLLLGLCVAQAFWSQAFPL